MTQRSRFFDSVGTNLPAITGVAATDILTSTAHGLQIGQAIIFTALTGGAGLVTGTYYFVTANSFAANTFKLAATQGGADINFTTDISAATANTGDRTYSSDAWAQVISGLMGDGVVAAGNEMAVTENSPTGMSVKVATGKAFIQGYFLEVYSAFDVVTISAAHASLARIDRVIARRDLTNRTCVLAVLTGTPAASPVAPALTQNTAGIYEIPLAQIAVGAAVVTILNANITDERGARATGSDIAAILKGTGAHAHTGVDGSGTKITYSNLLSIPSTFAPAVHTHVDGSTGGVVDWTSIGSKPSTFSPITHAHDSAVAGHGGTISHGVLTSVGIDDHHAKSHVHSGDGSGTVAYSSLSGVPSTFAPTAHASAHATGGGDPITPASIGAWKIVAAGGTVGTQIFVGTGTPSGAAEGDVWIKG